MELPRRPSRRAGAWTAIHLEAARRLGADPAKCRAFEDADVGMESIRAAGMEAVDVRLMEGYPLPEGIRRTVKE